MSMASSSSSSIIITQKYSDSFSGLPWNPISRLAISNSKNDEYTFCGGQTRLRHLSRDRRNSFVVCANTASGGGTPPPPPGKPSSSNSIGWVLGLGASFVLPFFSNKLGPLAEMKSRIENTVQTVEDIVETVEKVAEKVDEIAEDIGDDLPQGKLRDLVDLIENVAEKTAKTADCLDDVIDKVQEVGDQMDDVVEAALKNPKSSKSAKPK